MSAVCGLLPRVGETVLVSPSAGPHIGGTHWLQVNAVRSSNEPGWIYLDGTCLDSPAQERTFFVRIEGLVIRR
jgi:hypothetical protein